MIVRAYLDWSTNASAQDRSEAVGALSRIYLEGELSPADKRDADAALTMALEDPSPLVRRAMADALGGSDVAPRHVIATLAADQPEIAAVILANSPLLSDAQIVEHVAFGAPSLQLAAASRPLVSAAVTSALAEVCDSAVAAALLDNGGAEVSLASLQRLVERHGEDGAFREALLARGDVPPDLHLALAAAAARQLSAFAVTCGWLAENRALRLQREATETAAIRVAQTAGDGDVREIAARLRTSGQLTPQLLMRAVLSGEIRLFAAALADLAEVDPARAQGFVLGRSMLGFGALYRKAGLPRALEPAFAAAVAAWQELSRNFDLTEGRLSRLLIEMTLDGVALLAGPEIERLRAVLMAFQAEAARDDARLRIADILAAPPVIAEETTSLGDDLAISLEGALELELELREAA
jgi:uncharacterized protein (DUF2336 family)